MPGRELELAFGEASYATPESKQRLTSTDDGIPTAVRT